MKTNCATLSTPFGMPSITPITQLKTDLSMLVFLMSYYNATPLNSPPFSNRNSTML